MCSCDWSSDVCSSDLYILRDTDSRTKPMKIFPGYFIPGINGKARCLSNDEESISSSQRPSRTTPKSSPPKNSIRTPRSPLDRTRAIFLRDRTRSSDSVGDVSQESKSCKIATPQRTQRSRAHPRSGRSVSSGDCSIDVDDRSHTSASRYENALRRTERAKANKSSAELSIEEQSNPQNRSAADLSLPLFTEESQAGRPRPETAISYSLPQNQLPTVINDKRNVEAQLTDQKSVLACEILTTVAANTDAESNRDIEAVPATDGRNGTSNPSRGFLNSIPSIGGNGIGALAMAAAVQRNRLNFSPLLTESKHLYQKVELSPKIKIAKGYEFTEKGLTAGAIVLNVIAITNDESVEVRKDNIKGYKPPEHSKTNDVISLPSVVDTTKAEFSCRIKDGNPNFNNTMNAPKHEYSIRHRYSKDDLLSAMIRIALTNLATDSRDIATLSCIHHLCEFWKKGNGYRDVTPLKESLISFSQHVKKLCITNDDQNNAFNIASTHRSASETANVENNSENQPGPSVSPFAAK